MNFALYLIFSASHIFRRIVRRMAEAERQFQIDNCEDTFRSTGQKLHYNVIDFINPNLMARRKTFNTAAIQLPGS